MRTMPECPDHLTYNPAFGPPRAGGVCCLRCWQIYTKGQEQEIERLRALVAAVEVLEPFLELFRRVRALEERLEGR